MRLIDADELERVAVIVDGRLVVYLTDIHNAPTVKAYTEEEVQEIREEVAKEFKDIIDIITTVEEPYKNLTKIGYIKEAENGSI